MTNDLGDEIDAVLRRTRELDPSAGEEAVRRFVREIAEMQAAFDTLDIQDAPLVTAFSPSWLPEHQP